MSTFEDKRPITPLWIISLFVSFTEVVIGYSIPKTSGIVQYIFVFFVVIFPTAVAVAFFIILWKRNYLFYPPSEYGETDVMQFVKAMNNGMLLENQTKPQSESYIALFLIKGEVEIDDYKTNKILTYFSKHWESFLIINCRYDPVRVINEQLNELKIKIADEIGFNENDFELKYAGKDFDLSNIKYSYGEKRDVNYFYKFFFVSFISINSNSRLLSLEFKINEQLFRWMTISEMKGHDITLQRNSDVLRALQVRFDKLIKIPLSFDEKLCNRQTETNS